NFDVPIIAAGGLEPAGEFAGTFDRHGAVRRAVGDEPRREGFAEVGERGGGGLDGGGFLGRGRGGGGNGAAAGFVNAGEVDDGGDGVGLVAVEAVTVDLIVVRGGADEHREVPAGGAAHHGDAGGIDAETGGFGADEAQGGFAVVEVLRPGKVGEAE